MSNKYFCKQCQQCGCDITEKTVKKKALWRTQYCDKCSRIRYKQKYLERYKRDPSLYKIKKPKAVAFESGLSSVKFNEALRVLAWVEKAYFAKFGKKYKSQTLFYFSIAYIKKLEKERKNNNG